MTIRTTKTIFFFVVLLYASLSAMDVLAERTLVIQMGEAKCDTLSVSGKPPNGGYHVEEIWSQSPGEDVVNYSIDKDKGLICFKPLSVGSAKIRVRGQRYELDRYGKEKSSEPFYRAFKVRIRPEKKSGTSGRMY